MKKIELVSWRSAMIGQETVDTSNNLRNSAYIFGKKVTVAAIKH